MGKKYTTGEYAEFVKDTLGEEYTLVSDYVDSKTSVVIHHSECGKEYEVQPRKVRMKKRCHHCHMNKAKDTTWYKERVKTLVQDEYEVLGEYVNNKQDIKMKHCKCGHEFDARPAHFLDGRRCPKCRMSKGEALIADVLSQFNLKYKAQVRLDKCKNVHALPFDFGVYSLNGDLISLIEFDGEQHFHAVEFFGDVKGFERRVKNDQIKTDFCILRGIPLLRIPYVEAQPKTALTRFLVDVLMSFQTEKTWQKTG
ncbi:DUF2726 domain-containing protein [Rossellomorea marisflavi]|uniref:DUF2726 domain-containing protein n=1 Tax=Rossellomorea marisflavi TaxID=189381 RepID=UPI003F9F8DB8